MSDTDHSSTPAGSDGEGSGSAGALLTLRVATWNVLHAEHPGGRCDNEALSHAVAALDADIVGLQEVDSGMLRSGRLHQAAAASAAVSGGRHAYVAARRRWDGGTFGNALVVRGEIEVVHGFRLPRRSWRSERRAALVATARLHSTSWTVGITHLSVDRAESTAQLDFVLDVLEAAPAPRLLLGDLNRRAHEVTQTFTDRGWATTDTGPTYPAGQPVLRIDHIAVHGAQIAGSGTAESPISDHRAAWAEVRLAGAKPPPTDGVPSVRG